MNSTKHYLIQFFKNSKKKNQFDCLSTKSPVPNSNLMPKSEKKPTSTNSHSEASISVPTSTLEPISNLSVNLPSTSSFNSTPVKPRTSKSNEVVSIERKQKSLNSRQKKFHRHFNQVATDEEVINCMWILSNIYFFTLSKIISLFLCFTFFQIFPVPMFPIFYYKDLCISQKTISHFIQMFLDM